MPKVNDHPTGENRSNLVTLVLALNETDDEIVQNKLLLPNCLILPSFAELEARFFFRNGLTSERPTCVHIPDWSALIEKLTPHEKPFRSLLRSFCTQGCQMVYFQTKNHNFVYLGRPWNGKL
jgi:hypothetical protein